MSASVLSLNIGAAAPITGGKGRPTGIFKEPVDSVTVHDPAMRKGDSGVDGDFIGDRKHHGGTDQAVYAFAREELDWWQAELGRDLRNGAFGENVTTTDLAVDGAVIGEVWRIGSAVLRVAGPRIPCSTFAAAMDGIPQWVKRFAARGKSGAYLAVVEPGTMTTGDEIEIVERPSHGIDVPLTFRAWFGDLDAARRVHDAGCMSEASQAELSQLLSRRG